MNLKMISPATSAKTVRRTLRVLEFLAFGRLGPRRIRVQDKLAFVQASGKPEAAIQCDPVPPTGWALFAGILDSSSHFTHPCAILSTL